MYPASKQHSNTRSCAHL